MRKLLQRRFHCEQLESRELLSGAPWLVRSDAPVTMVQRPALFSSYRPAAPVAAPIQSAPQARPVFFPSQTPPIGPTMPAPAPTQGSYLPGSSLRATLSDPNSTATGFASFQSTNSQAVTSSVFRVTVNGLARNATIEVKIDGAVVGLLQTNASGSGSFVMSSSQPGQVPNPQTPAVHAGSAITVGPLTGAFARTGAV